MKSFPRPRQLSRLARILVDSCLSVLCGAAWFLVLHGRSPLSVTNVNWIYNRGGDIFQHQIGWEFFRQEPWRFPVGTIASYGYPFGTNIVYTDSIPLLAIPLKLLSPLLKPHFQYLGLWELMSLVGQMLVGMRLLAQFSDSYPKRLLGGSLLVLSPPLLWRAFGHDALTAQWILLAGIWCVVLEHRHRLWGGAWVTLFTIALLVHPYFVGMLVVLWAASLAIRFSTGRSPRAVLPEIVAVPSVLVLLGYCVALFEVGTRTLLANDFGHYSWNLNGFINPLDASSAVLKPMALGTIGQQEEGYSYLGLGNIALLPVAVILFLTRDRGASKRRVLAALAGANLLLALFALSNNAYLGQHVLWKIELPQLILHAASLFRASARFIWPVFYSLVLFGIISVLRNMPRATPLLLATLVVQFLDIRPLYSAKAPGAPQELQAGQLRADFWETAASTSQHVVLIPAGLGAWEAYPPLARYAAQHGLTLNTGYFARADYEAIEAHADGIWDGLQAGQSDPHTLYVFWAPAWRALAENLLSEELLICQVDGYTVVLSKQNSLVQSGRGLEPYCSPP